MLSEKNLSKKFFTRTGEEIFRIEEVIEQPEVVLVNLDSRLKLQVRLGTPEAKEFMPIAMPLIKPAAVPKIKKAKKKVSAAGKSERGRPGRKPGWGSSKYYGVSFHKQTGEWKAKINRKDDRWYGGEFETEELAAAKVAEHLGDHKEAARLRKLSKVLAEVKPGPVKTTQKGSSKYYGVSYVKTTGRWTAQINRGDLKWFKSGFESEELAAAAVQEKLGNKKEAAELRKKDRTKDKIAKLRAPILVGKFMCHECGETYDKKPDKCNKCNSGAVERV